MDFTELYRKLLPHVRGVRIRHACFVHEFTCDEFAFFSRDIPRSIEVAERIRSGTVRINDCRLLKPLAAYGGYKQSGVGRELGTQGLLEFTQVKHIHVDLNIDRFKKFWYDHLFND